MLDEFDLATLEDRLFDEAAELAARWPGSLRDGDLIDLCDRIDDD